MCFQYNTVIFESSVGMDHNTALLVAGFNGVAYFFSTLIPIWTIDWYPFPSSDMYIEGSLTMQTRSSQAHALRCRRAMCLHGYSRRNGVRWWS